MGTILLEIDKTYRDEISTLQTSHAKNLTVINAQRLDGNAEIIQALVTLGGMVIPVIGKIMIEAIRAKKHVCIKKDGLEITGITEKNVVSVLKQLEEEA